MSLGSDLRSARLRAGLTLAEVAAKAELTPGHLSLIERDRANPSIGALNRLCEAIGVRVGDFFSPSGPPDPATLPADELIGIVKKGERKTLIYPGSQIRHELLCPDLQHTLEIFQTFAPPGTGSGPVSHEGEECGIVLSGKMEFHLADKTYIIAAGESICFNSKVVHTWVNMGEGPLEVIWVITPPHF